MSDARKKGRAILERRLRAKLELLNQLGAAQRLIELRCCHPAGVVALFEALAIEVDQLAARLARRAGKSGDG